MLMRAVLRFLLLGSFAGAAHAGMAQAQKTFEGTITYDVNMAGKQMQLGISTRGKKVRQNMEFSGAPVVSQGTYQIFDYDTGDIITVVPAMKRYMVLNLKTVSVASKEKLAGRDSAREKALSSMRATGRQETIAGVGCEVYVMQDRPGDEWCLTTALGHFLGFGGDSATTRASSAVTGTPPMSQLARDFKDGVVVLRMRMAGPDGRDVTMVATRIDRTVPPANNFTIPTGFEEMQNPLMPRP
jgi:hypothetical protein